MNRKVTSTDVARAAGVSRTTVSYALNDTGELPQATRQRIKSIASSLGYIPSAAARTLRGARSDLVVLVMPEWVIGYAVGQLVLNLTERLRALDLALMVTQLGPAWDHPWRSVSPVAVLSAFPLPAGLQSQMRASGCEHIIQPETPEAGVSQHGAGSRAQIEHLAARGHRRIGFALSTDPHLDWFARIRADAAAATAGELGLAELGSSPVGLDPALAREAVRTWTAGPDPITAVAAYNDDVAMNVLAAGRDLGLRCPEDLAVIGIDNTPAAHFANPGLSSVDVAMPAAAGELTQRLVTALGLTAKVAEPRDPLAELRVIVRGTT